MNSDRLKMLMLALGILGSGVVSSAQESADSVAVLAPSDATVSAITVVDEPKPCQWWQKRKCQKPVELEGLPADAPRQGLLITVDTKHNNVYLFRDGELLAKAPAATGSEKLLKKGLKSWMFHTPRGRMTVLRKVVDPVWTKPDWAFVEVGEKVPPPDSPRRKVKGHLGKYALDLGDGILIHGTKDVESLGKNASHGCIRLPDEMLELVYKSASVGTNVFIY
ncbi:MAG TPA: L,D-transpeptidase [Thermoanaerobaculia bacterium]|nr:L,D-transpeptidase [Thermoanaerobaculia bacterium]